jgi:hypothetical protein
LNEVEKDDDESEASPTKIEPEPIVAAVEESLKTEVPQYIPQYVTPSEDID